MLRDNPMASLALGELIEVLEGISLRYWEFWRQREQSTAAVYADALRLIARKGTAEDLLRFAHDIEDFAVDRIDYKLLLELAPILQLLYRSEED